jgi:hemolysin D
MTFFYRLEALGELLARYRNVFIQSWKERRNLGGGIFNENEAEFLPAALSLQEKPVSSTAKNTGRVLILMFSVALLWSVLGKVDIVVNASGKIIPSDYTKVISSVEVASVSSLYVSEGLVVKAGDLLLELDSSAPDAEHEKAKISVMQALLDMARSEALIKAVHGSRPPELARVDDAPIEQLQFAKMLLDSQYRDFYARISRINDEINRYSAILPFVTTRAIDYRALSEVGDVSKHSWQEKEQARIDLEGQLHDAINQRKTLIAQTIKDANDTYSQASKILHVSLQDARRTGEHSKRLKLFSPVDGTVQQLSVHAVGGVVPSVQPLMMIVPNNSRIEVEAMLDNKDIGFVKEGQHAEVKIDAFDYTRYGTVSAKVTHISRDAVEDERRGLIYRVRVALAKSEIVLDEKPVSLSAGMSVNVEIKTGERRIIQYLLSPLIQHKREALHER